MESAPSGNDVVASVAVPLLRLFVPREVEPSMKVTVPVAVPAVAGVTVAVRVRDCPTVDGFREEATSLVVAAASVTSETAADVLVMKSAFPA